MADVNNREEVTKRNYEEANDWHIEKSRSHSWNPQISVFASRLQKGAKVLDVGCGGSGRDMEEFHRFGFTVDGLDYSSPAIASLKSHFPNGIFYEADMRATGLPSEHYDGIWACATVLNIQKSGVPSTLLEFKRIMKPNGILFVSVKEGEGEKMVPDIAGERFFDFFSRYELQELVEKAGFKVWRTDVMEDTRFSGKNIQPAPPRWICLYAVRYFA